MRARFKDKALDEQFEKDGYAIIRNYANADQIAGMQQVLDDCYKDHESSYSWKHTLVWNTIVMSKEEVRLAVSERLMEYLRPIIKENFFDYLSFFGYTLIKPPSETPNPVNLHRDSSTVNEDKYEYMTMWLPLVDINRKNGCMYVVPGSHRLFTDELPFGVEWPYMQYHESLKRHFVDLPMKAGDALLFSGKIVHGSHANQTKGPRHVVASVLIHPDTEMLFNYYDSNTNMVKSYEVDPWFFFRSEFAEPVGKYPLKRSYTYNQPDISEKAIKEFYARNPVKTNLFSNLLRRLGVNS